MSENIQHAGELDFLCFSSLSDASAELARDTAIILEDAISRKGEALLAVPGGGTPVQYFIELAKQSIDWSKLQITLTDERWVSEDSDQSNSALVRRIFLTGHSAKSRFSPPNTRGVTLLEAANAWDNAIRFQPEYDLVVLGVGDDGHFASLFPDSKELAVGLSPDAGIFAMAIEDRSPPRLTQTLYALTRTQRLVLLIAGQAKRAIVQMSLSRDADPLKLPVAALLRQSRARPTCYWGDAS